MNLIMDLIISSIFLLCTYFDYKQNKVPNIAIAGMWLLMLFYPSYSFEILLSFSLIFFINEIFIIKGWGDVLGIPIFIVLIFKEFPEFYYFSYLGICLPILISAIIKKPIPDYPFMFFFLILAISLKTFQ